MNPIAASVVGSAFATNRSADIERVEQDTASQASHLDGLDKAELAGDVGETKGDDSHASERDADGRRAWEFRRGKRARSGDFAIADSNLPKDPSGQSGNELDLCG
jgi:hypothetical protein